MSEKSEHTRRDMNFKMHRMAKRDGGGKLSEYPKLNLAERVARNYNFNRKLHK